MRWAAWSASTLPCAHPERLRSLTVVNGWATAHAHTRRCFELRLMLLKHEGPAAYVRAQPIFLYPADWLAKNAERAAQEEAHGLGGFQGADTLQRRIAALLAFDATPHLASLRLPTLICRRARRRAGAELDVRTACRGNRGSDAPHRAVGRPRGQRHAGELLQFPFAGLPGPPGEAPPLAWTAQASISYNIDAIAFDGRRVAMRAERPRVSGGAGRRHDGAERNMSESVLEVARPRLRL